MEKTTYSSATHEFDRTVVNFLLFVLGLSAVMLAFALLPLWVAAAITTSLIGIASYAFVMVAQSLGNQEPHGRHPGPK